MTDEPTRPVPGNPGHPVDLPGRRPTEPAQQPPVDPWAGSAPVVPPPAYESPEPYVIVVERPRRRRWPWLLGGLAGLALACCIGAAAIWTPISREYPAHLGLGTSAAGLEQVRSPEIDRAVDQLLVQMFRQDDIDDGLAALLGDPARPERAVILIAATKLILDPDEFLDQAVHEISNRTVQNLTDYRRLGAAIKCADTEDDQGKAVIACAWADYGSMGAGIFYGGWTMDEAAKTLLDLRGAVVRRG